MLQDVGIRHVSEETTESNHIADFNNKSAASIWNIFLNQIVKTAVSWCKLIGGVGVEGGITTGQVGLNYISLKCSVILVWGKPLTGSSVNLFLQTCTKSDDFRKSSKGGGVIFNPKTHIADFGNSKQGFLSMKLIQKSNFRVQGMFFNNRIDINWY